MKITFENHGVKSTIELPDDLSAGRVITDGVIPAMMGMGYAWETVRDAVLDAGDYVQEDE